MFRTIIRLLTFLVSVLLIKTYSYSNLNTPIYQLHDVSSSDAWAQQVAIDYSDIVYYDQALACPTTMLIDQYTNEHLAESTFCRGFDQNTIKHTSYFTLPVGGGGHSATNVGQTVAGTPVWITINALDKFNIADNYMIRGAFTPSTAAFTNYGQVVDVAYTYDTISIEITGWDPTLKFGIDGGTQIPDNTPLFFSAPRQTQAGGRILTPQTAPKVITNEFQIIRLAYGMTEISATEKQYIAGTPQSKVEMEKRGEFNRKRERAHLLNPATSYRKGPTSPGDSWGMDTDSAMAGIIPEVKSYFTGNTDKTGSYQYTKGNFNIVNDLDAFCAKLNNVSLEDIAKRRLTYITSALRNAITVLKRDKQGVELAPNDAYGIPGITTLEWGSMTLDLMVSEALEENFTPISTIAPPDVYAAFAMTLPMIEYRVFPGFRAHLRLNVTPTNDLWTIENEFAVVESHMVHQPGTPYYGFMFPSGSWI